MGQLCSRPRTVEDTHPTEPETEGVRVTAESGHRQHTTPHSHKLHSETVQHVLPERQGSDAELSELDVVVQQLRNNQNSVTGSAPELLQQWDHDHRVVLESIDASIQVHACSLSKAKLPLLQSLGLICFVAVQRAQHQNHREGNASRPIIPGPHHIPSVYLHTVPAVPNSKAGDALQSGPPPTRHPAQQAALPLQQEPLLIQAKQAYAGSSSTVPIPVSSHQFLMHICCQ